jgi:hypothetical protein
MSASTQSPLPSHAPRAASSPSSAAQLPVPQIRQAHDLYLDPVDAEPAATVVAPPYPGMAVGDEVIFSFAPALVDPIEVPFTVPADGVGKVITWALDSNDLWSYYTEQVATFYRVEPLSGAESRSATQVITIDTVPTPRLPPPAMADGQHELDPGLYPDGVTVTVPLYPGAAVGDGVLLYWQGKQAANTTVKWQALDRATIDSGVLEIAVEAEWLAANSGSTVALTYQYAREGAAQSSEPLTLTILLPLVLEPAIVEGAQAEGGAGDNKGFLLAGNALSGVYIRVPDAEIMGDAVSLEVHWDGHEHGGKHVASAPHSAGTPLRFRIPPTAVAANIGGESKRFDVFYRLVLPGGRVHTSTRYHLLVKPLPSSNYPPVQCRQAQGKPGLSLNDVPAEGAELYVLPWPFAAAGQRLTVWITGVSTTNTAVDYVARDGLPATQAELDARAIGGRVPKAILATLKVDNAFTLRAKVSHDGGETALQFPSSTVRWLG